MPNTNEAGTPANLRQLFQSDEVLWFNDGRWGACGYAMPNGQGKSWTNNMDIYHAHKVLGESLFALSHMSDVRYNQPPHKDFWWEWHKTLINSRNVIKSHRMDPGTTKNIKDDHVTNNRKTFLVYPVPFFAGRVRQEDIRVQIEFSLLILSNLQQHNCNDKSMYIDGSLVNLVVGYINEMLTRVAVKYFGYTTDEIAMMGENIVIEESRFSSESYIPQARIASVEFSTERPPLDWWPTENDLSAIRGIAYTDAIKFAQRWPLSYISGEGDWESTLPGIVDRTSAGDPLAKKVATAHSAASGIHAPD